MAPSKTSGAMYLVVPTWEIKEGKWGGGGEEGMRGRRRGRKERRQERSEGGLEARKKEQRGEKEKEEEIEQEGEREKDLLLPYLACNC